MITIAQGNTGQGKTFWMAGVARKLFKRNLSWYKQTGKKRLVATNLIFGKDVEKKYGEFIRYWKEPKELIPLEGCDVIWDEVSTHLDSNSWKNTGIDFKAWLRHHDKRGVDIYATAQNFKDIDIAIKRITDKVYILNKIFGSRRPHPTKPPVRFVWGLIMRWGVMPNEFREEKEDIKRSIFDVDFIWISKRLSRMYNTLQEIPVLPYVEMKHLNLRCERWPICKVQHEKHSY